ncbi:MAG TPA: hypothetical protein VFS76_13760 [Pyrinomonadaceae bacterium]|nr:hypothetical protein [Pyrinomonadaceae bacterium]
MNWIRALILLGLLTGPAAAQRQSVDMQGTPLQTGTPIERQISVGQTHTFSVTAPEDNLVQITVEQRGIDVVVSIYAPGGKKLGEYDSPNGADGPENVSFVVLEKGPYRIQVTPLNTDPDTAAGRFQIKIVEVREATEDELKAGKNQEALKARAVALLGDVEMLIPELRVPQTRIRAQIQAAQMLWETDEKRALRFINDAIAGVKELFSKMDPDTKGYFKNYHGIAYLRYEIMQVLKQRQPELALSFLRSTPALKDPYGNQLEGAQDGVLEAEIANEIAKTDPKRTLELARENLKTNYASNLVSVVVNLRQKNPEMAAELAGEIASKLMGENLLKHQQAPSLLVGLLSISEPPRQTESAATNGTAPPRLLSPQQYRDLLQKALNEALNFKPPPGNMYSPERDQAWNLLQNLHGLSAEIDAVMTGASAAVEKKINEYNALNNLNNPQLLKVAKYQNAINDSNVAFDDTLASIAKAPKDHREQLYVQIASRAAMNGDTARAKQIISDHVKNPYQRQQALAQIEQQETQRSMQKGKVEEALKNVAEIEEIDERANMLSQIAGQIGPGQKRTTALALLEQARGLLSSSAQAHSQPEMNALLEIARAFSRYDTKRAFEIVDPLVDQFNEMTIAARTLEGFGYQYFEQDELNLNNGNAVGGAATQITTTLGSLAQTNFDRAKATADRLRLPEVRLRAYLDIAQQFLTPMR